MAYGGWTRSGVTVAWEQLPPTIRGIALMCVSTVAFSGMHALVRFVSQDLPPLQVAFFRNLFGLLVLAPLLLRSRLVMLRTPRIGLHALRGVINMVAMFFFFTALSLTPLAKVTALSFAAPIFMAVLSVLFLGETFRLYRWLAIFAGFAGTLVILRPGLVPLELGPVLVMASALLWAIAMILIKILSRTESSVTIVAWMGIFLCVFSIGPALWVWQPVTLVQLGWMALIGLCGSIAQIALSQALKESDPTAVLPFDFLKLVWTTLLGIWVFAEIPDIYTWFGAAIVFGSGLFIAYRERRNSKENARPPVIPE